MRILIADDAGFIRQIIRETAEQAGHQIVAEATTGPDAIEMALEYRPDLVIMDVVLPDLNGLEAATEISSQDSEIMIAAVSSLTTDWIQEQATAAGCFYFFKKPFTKEELLKVFEMCHVIKGSELRHG